METMIGVRDADNTVDAPQTPTCAELTRVVEAMQRDWIRLNEFLVATAIRHRWCPDFEQRLAFYNTHFELLQLRGRDAEMTAPYVERDPFGMQKEAGTAVMYIADMRIEATLINVSQFLTTILAMENEQ